MASSRTRAGLLLATMLAAPVLLTPTAATAGGAAPVPVIAPAAIPLVDRPLAPLSGTIDPSWGNIRTFWGDSSPFWGNIRTFWGSVNPYEGDLTGFWGNIRTFNDGTTSGSLAPLWGNIRTFSGDLGASWGNIRTFWGGLSSYQAAPQDYATLAGQIGGMVQQSQAFWGTAVQAQTGQSFQTAFAGPLLAKYGIDLSDPQSLAALDPGTREHFFMDWYDGLMNYTGTDHVDHWMNEINWSPALTQTLGSGKDAIIGLLDFTVTGDSTQNIIKYGGISTFANGHGAAVASLMVAAHDGKGIMGIAPQASVVAYNPFDATQTAGWTDIKNGIVMLAQQNASIVNMSLGVPGWTLNQGWNGVFMDKNVQKTVANTLFVVAAGNDGITQTQSIAWDKNNPYLIVVGSADPSRNISAFSNRPGDVCLLDGDKCKGDYLKNHFIVAPGELILVSDGAGGIVRRSGTSFAAPLVSGTIALIQDRWPWLANYPRDVAAIILKSARDLGAPGIDPVYGAGELDVLAALSPLDLNKVIWKQVVNGSIVDTNATSLRATTATQRSSWETSGAYFTAFESTGSSLRDFEIPMSSKLANQTVSINGASEAFMTYLQGRFSTWLGTPGTGSGSTSGQSGGDGNSGAGNLGGGSNGFAGFTDRPANSVALAGFGDTQASMQMTSRVSRSGFRDSNVPFQTALRLAATDQHYAVEFGQGNGAVDLGSQAGFAMSSDYDVAAGGANPFVGLASGGAYARAELRLAPGLRLSTSVTQRALERSLDGLSLSARHALGGYDPYRARAGSMALTWQPGGRVSTSIAYTMLHEDKALLGTESVDHADLPQGSTTDATTLGADVRILPSLMLAATGTIGRTRPGDAAASNIAVGGSGLVSSSFEVAVSKDRLLDRHDRLRISFAQPMHVESGTIDYRGVQVVDRLTGALGVVTQALPITAGERRFVGEMIYGRGLLHDTAQIGLFGRINLNAASTADIPAYTVGSSFRLAF